MPAAPAPPAPYDQDTASVEEWHDYLFIDPGRAATGIYMTWLETATDEEIVGEMAAIPVEGRPLSPSEKERFYQCELRRRRPATKTQAKTKAKE